MGLVHPFSDEFEEPRGGGGSPERALSPPLPAPCCPGPGYLEHEMSRMDTLAGIAIKYGVEISDIKRVNSLVSDRQMFAHKTLLIPLAGRHTQTHSPVRLSGSGQRIKRTWSPNHHQNTGTTDSFESLKYKSAPQRTSPAMSTLQRYYGLTPENGELTECSTEMSLYCNNNLRRIGSEPLPKVSPASSAQSAERSWNSVNPALPPKTGTNGTKINGATKARKDGSVRRRQKVEADPLSNIVEIQEDVLADPAKIVKSVFPRAFSGVRLSTDISSQDSVPNSNPLSVNGFNSVRKSPSAPSFADTENVISMWSSHKWSLSHEAFTRPLLDGLTKPVSARRIKAALD